MRAKEEIVKILSKRRLPDVLTASTWSDLVSSIQGFTVEEKAIFVKLVAHGNTRKAGERLKRVLYINAKSRAAEEVSAMLADDSLTLEELDSLI